MKVFICGLIVSIFYLALASGEAAKKSAALVTDKSSDSKPKRDASLLNSVYHGPSYKYLPPQSASYGSYAGSSAGFSGGYISGYRPIGSGHVYRQPSVSSPGSYHISSPHGLGHHGPATSYSSGHQGIGYPMSNHYAGGQASTRYFGSGTGRPHTYVIGHGYGSSGLEHNLHTPLAANAATSGSGYQFSKDAHGSVYAVGSSGLGSTQVLSSSLGSALDEEHHTGHIHNGAGEHVYVVSSAPATSSGGGGGGSHNSGNEQGNHVVSSVSYLPPVKQHPLPSSNSYGDPISTTGNSYNTKYHGTERGPGYATGHKGLGYFGFTANKPNMLHTSLSGSSFKPHAYSKAPFTPSIFLGSKFEDSAHHNNPSTQYLAPLGGESDSAGYEYPIPTGPSINYQEPSYQHTADVQSAAEHEPDSSYLTPKNNQDSLHEITSGPSSSYLPPSNSYGEPYST